MSAFAGKLYREWVIDARDGLRDPERRTDAMTTLRAMVEEEVLTPEQGKLGIVLKGDLAAMLAFARLRVPSYGAAGCLVGWAKPQDSASERQRASHATGAQLVRAKMQRTSCASERVGGLGANAPRSKLVAGARNQLDLQSWWTAV